MRLGGIVVTIAILATLVAFGFVGWFTWHPTSGGTRSAPGPQIQWPPLALSEAKKSYQDGFYVYNFTITAANSGITWGQVRLNLSASPISLNASAAPSVNLTVRASMGGLVATYEMLSSAPGWTFGGSSAPSVNESLLLSYPVSTFWGANELEVSVGGFNGTTGYDLPEMA
jgi:hypothetical protein